MTDSSKNTFCSNTDGADSCTSCPPRSRKSLSGLEQESTISAESLKNPLNLSKMLEIGAGIILIAAGIASKHLGASYTVFLLLLISGMIVTGRPILISGLRAVMKLRLDMNFLMLIAAVGGMIIGETTEAAVIVILFAIAKLIEEYSLNRSGQSIKNLMEMAPQTALVIRDGVEVEVPVQQVELGETVLIKPGSAVPVDGEVISGQSSLNLAAITGESIPVSCSAGDKVLSGGINGEGALMVKATRKPGDSTLDRIIKLVQTAREDKPRLQSTIERFARYYTPGVVIMAAITAVLPPLLFNGVWSDWIYRALAMLLISCPCALIVSTPVTILSALTNAARNGVLIKGGTFLEALAKIRAFALDKTGTLTSGDLSVNNLYPLNGTTSNDLLKLAATVESHSEHLIGRAISRHARAQGLEIGTPVNFSSYPGKGASAEVENREIFVGKHELFEELNICDEAVHPLLDDVEASNQTPVMVGSKEKINGVISVADNPRPEAAQTLQDLRKTGVNHIALLTGDNRKIGEAVGKAIGCDEVYAELLPENKVDIIKSMRKRFGRIVMVGDGVNDAPALTAADIGIAMGGAGSDATLETADIVLMADRIERLPWLMRLSKKTHRLLITNIAGAIGIKLAFLILAASGNITLWMAVFADMGVTLLVVFNGMRALVLSDTTS